MIRRWIRSPRQGRNKEELMDIDLGVRVGYCSNERAIMMSME